MARTPKPLAAISRHMTKEERQERAEAEEKLKLGTDDIYPPAWLGERGTFIFRRIVKEGLKIGLWDNLDNDALARYADLCDKLILLHDRLDREGIILEKQTKEGPVKYTNPTYGAYIQCQDACRKQSASLGITTIERLKLATGGGVEKPKNKFIKLIKDDA